MPNVKVRPILTSNFPHARPNDLSLELAYNLRTGDECGRLYRHGSEFWHARRAFLTSYSFTKENVHGGSFKERLKRSVKELNDAAAGVVSDMHQGMSNRRLGFKIFRFTMTLPSLVLVTIRCFTPWLNKKETLK